jgi:glycosyltransferase involved in cell wall biosynthesis
LKIAVVFPPMLVAGRPLDFTRLLDDPRGTTGSEIMTLAFAQELTQLGHDVTLFIENPNAPAFYLRKDAEPVKTHNLPSEGWLAPGFDACLSALDCNILKRVPKSALRVCLQQVNDFDYGQAGFDSWVDLYVSPSAEHVEHMKRRAPEARADKWRVVPNGCYADAYASVERIAGQCVYTSSPDRGLHLVLQAWDKIKEAVPNASLRIYYYALARYLAEWQGKDTRGLHPFLVEHGRRANIIADLLPKLKDVEVVGATSRNQLAKDLSESEALLYPCEPIDWCEGFSCATLEGCASGALPILVGADALSSIYREAIPVVQPPAEKHHELWTQLAILALKQPGWRAPWMKTAKSFAEKHDWRILAKRLETVLLEGSSDK